MTIQIFHLSVEVEVEEGLSTATTIQTLTLSGGEAVSEAEAVGHSSKIILGLEASRKTGICRQVQEISS